jgi:hypothetical protein
MPATSSEVFGLRAFASVYTALIFAPALGCWLLAAQLAGRLYDAMSSQSSSQLGSWLSCEVYSGKSVQGCVCVVQRVGTWLLCRLSAALRALVSVDAECAGDSYGDLRVPEQFARASSSSSVASSSNDTNQPACVGPACFRLTFVILAALCCVAVAASASLTRSTAVKYKHHHHHHQQQQEQEMVQSNASNA